jgi:type VI secretion system protein ImpL
MTFKVLFVSLLLYIALAWVGAAYLYTGPDVVHHALLWTAIGLIAVLAFIIFSRLFGWWRLSQAKRAAKPAAAPAAAATAGPAHPDDQALLTLIAEANAALAKSPAFAGKAGGNPLSALPIYLLVGPEASGKTSTFLSSGLEPQLLAGQGITPIASTRLAHFWLAKNALFVELSGRAFAGELARWSQLLRLLRGQSSVSFVKKLWGQPEQPVELRGAIAFCDAKDFTSASADPQRLEKSIRDWQERLRAIAEVFGAEFPVYVTITKCDKITFFPDFFRRLPETEVNQVFGCTLPPANSDRSSPGEVFAEAEARRLTASFRPLYHAIAQKRLSQLAHEPNPAQRGGIYEFPRELKRIRTPLVQFLTDVFRPNTLGPGPVLRGYYLTGTRESEAALVDPAATGTNFGAGSMETTNLFRGETTQIFQPGGASRPAGQGRIALKWLFVADLFHKIVLPDRLARPVQPAVNPIDRYRRFAMAGVCGLCVLLCAAFGISWGNNRGLVSGVQAEAMARVGHANGPAPLSDLQSLEQLRVEILRLRGHMPLGYHWGLYTGDRILPEARAAWFRRFQRVLLIDLNSLMVADLGALSTSPDDNAPSDPVYRILKTHLTITSGNCTVDSALVSKVLKTYRGRIAPGGGTDWQTLADRQIDFFAAELPAGNPARLPEDVEARDRAREYLRKIKGVDRLYASILANAESHVPKVASLKDTAPNYTQVLSGPEEVSAVFSKDGWTYFDKAAKETNSAILGEPCVVGESATGIVNAVQQNTETTHALERLYIADYIQRWQKFVTSFSVLKYNSPEDAAKKLETLSDHKSPLLAVLALTANQTNFPASTAPAADANALQRGIDKVFGSLKKAETAAKAVTGAPQETEASPSTPADITNSFQPVHWVEPPGSETWVVDKNMAYIDALSQLGHSMQEIAQGGGNPDPAVHQAAGQNYDKAVDTVRQIAKGFKPTGVDGLDTAVQALLEEPIRRTSPFIIRNIEGIGARKVNGDLHNFCFSQRTTFHKYPFQSSSSDDVSLNELAGFLQPASGAVWKFVQQSLGDLVVKEGSQWKPKDPSKKPQVTPELLAFLNRVQSAADVFYSGGASQPQLIYTLRPKLDPSFKDTILELEIDGKAYAWTTSLQKQFVWPAPPGTPTPGAVARLKTAGPSFPFASRPGIWGIFKILGDAEERELGAKVVVWKYGSGGVGRKELIQPAPVELEIVNFPGNVDVFNPKFWVGFQCPASAVQ